MKGARGGGRPVMKAASRGAAFTVNSPGYQDREKRSAMQGARGGERPAMKAAGRSMAYGVNSPGYQVR